jgi:NTE family protein
MKIGLALSGGGLRAAVFHMGVLARLAHSGLLEEITFLSTVSGGSICAGLIFGAHDYQWPSSPQFIDATVPRIRKLLTHTNLRNAYIRQMPVAFATLQTSAKAFANAFRKSWDITGDLSDLPDSPRWIINATCHETGKRWRFEKKWMGDYRFGNVKYPKFSISEAVAASAAATPLVGPLILHTRQFQWVKYDTDDSTQSIKPKYRKVHLWDGALYDNLGIEALFKRSDADIDFLIVSDAGIPLPETRFRSWAYPWRVIKIIGSQSQSLYTRWVMESIVNGSTSGSYFKIGNSGPDILKKANRQDEIDALCSSCLLESDVDVIRATGMVCRKLSCNEFERLYRHGFEVASFTLYAHLHDQLGFDFVQYAG